jgi:hypothetical protein
MSEGRGDVPALRSVFLPKTPRRKSLCVKASYRGAGSALGKQFWLHTTRPLSETFENFDIKLLVRSLTMWNKLKVHYPFAVEESLTFAFDICAFLGRGEPGVVHCRLCRFGSESYFHPQWLLCLAIRLSLRLAAKVNTNLTPLQLVVSEVLVHSKTEIVFPIFFAKVNSTVTLLAPSSSDINLTVRQTSIIPYRSSDLFDVFIRFWSFRTSRSAIKFSVFRSFGKALTSLKKHALWTLPHLDTLASTFQRFRLVSFRVWPKMPRSSLVQNTHLTLIFVTSHPKTISVKVVLLCNLYRYEDKFAAARSYDMHCKWQQSSLAHYCHTFFNVSSLVINCRTSYLLCSLCHTCIHPDNVEHAGRNWCSVEKECDFKEFKSK